MSEKIKKLINTIISYIIILAVTAFGVVLYLLGAGRRQNDQLSDLLLQQGGSPSGNIFILQIDAHSLEELGPYQTWTRDYVAEAIERLNGESDSAPAVIGVDVLYIGNTSMESDEHLTKACANGGNVVLGSLLNFDAGISQDKEGNYYLSNQVALFEEPYEDVKAVTTQGFVNGFADADGVIRHGLLKTQVPGKGEVSSFSYAVYRKYAEKNGLLSELDVPVNKDGYWYLNYQAAPGGYSNGYSLSDFIQGEIPMERFADSIVLIGPYAEGLMDNYKTAVDLTTPMYGVEIHANMIEAMLRSDFKCEVSTRIQAFLIALLIFLNLCICKKEKLRYSLAVLGFSCIGYPIAVYVLYQCGFLLNLIVIPVTGFLFTVGNVIVHYIKALTRKHQVEKTFKRYVAPEVVDKIMKTGMDQITLGGASVDIACLFVDIRGFTTMSEMMQPEEVVAILNRYLALTSSCIFRHHGTLDKFIGDATMAIFNAPLPQEDYVYEAVLTAMDMVEGARELEKELKEKFGKSVSFGIGVHCGKAVVGNIGTERRMDYTAIGDTVNTAARLEANAPAGTVLISRNVYEKLKNRIEAVSIGNLPLKGKKEELEVFRVLQINTENVRMEVDET